MLLFNTSLGSFEEPTFTAALRPFSRMILPDISVRLVCCFSKYDFCLLISDDFDQHQTLAGSRLFDCACLRTAGLKTILYFCVGDKFHKIFYDTWCRRSSVRGADRRTKRR